MSTEQDLEAKFWKSLKSDMTMMVGLVGVDDGHTRPLTAQVEDDQSPIWFFTSTDNALIAGLSGGTSRVIANFTAKGHDLFATIHGSLHVDKDRATIDRLWNPFIAAWFEGGKDDPKLALLRLDAERGEIWLNESSLFAGLKMLLGRNPREDYKDKVAEVTLR
jgi:general stress protein 26